MALKSVFRKQKKANVVSDSFFYFIAIVVFIVIAVTGSYIVNNFNTDFQADPDVEASVKLVMTDFNTDYPAWFDYGAGAVILLLWILVLVASFYVDTHPVFFITSIIVLMIAIFAVNQFISAIDDYLAEDEIAPIMLNFPISQFIVTNIEKFVALVGFTIAIALYAKSRTPA